MAHFSLIAESISFLQTSIRAWWNRLCSRGRQSATSPSFDEFHYDILFLMAGEIFLEDKLDLLSLCLVNKRCYLASVPWIYRDLTIHMKDIRSLDILKRLSGQANMARFVRSLTVLPHGRINREIYSRLMESAARLTGLKDVRIAADGKLAFDFLEKADLPHLRIELHRGSLLRGIANARLPRQNLLTCNFAGRLTWLEVVIKRSILYEGFKRDFIVAMQRCLALQTLHIFDHDDIAEDDAAAEVEEELFTAPFPRLHTFCLAIRSEVLNGRDLWLLGRQGAWAQLIRLSVCTPRHLTGFLTHAVRLRSLHVAIQGAEELGPQNLGLWLKQRQKLTILPLLQELRYSHTLNVRGTSAEYVLPWCLLERVNSTLAAFHLNNDQYKSGDHGAITPTAADIHKLRAMCPRLRLLTLDIQWELPVWPKEVFDVLRSWDELRYLRLVVQKSPRESIHDSISYRRGVPAMSEAAQSIAFDHLTSNRKNIVVEFAQWIDGPSAVVKPYRHIHAFYRDDLGCIRHTQECPRCKDVKVMDLIWKNANYAAWSDARLTFFREYHEFARRKDWGTTDDLYTHALQGIAAELQRRERNAKLEDLYGDNSTMLYEYLT